MECLRFGSSIPGKYWGCCAGSIMQDFNVDPDEKMSSQVTNGDGGGGIQSPTGGGLAFLGMTYKEIFLSRLRIGEFSTRDMPNHAFFIMLSKTQLGTSVGLKWLKIIKEAGFEFVRTVNNSVWNIDNYVFALFRNCGPNAVKDQFTPPKAWTDLPSVKTETWEMLSNELTTEELTEKQKGQDNAIYNKIGAAKFYTQEQLEKAGVPVMLSAIRTNFGPQGPETRKKALEAASKGGITPHYNHSYAQADPVIKATGVKPTPATEA